MAIAMPMYHHQPSPGMGLTLFPTHQEGGGGFNPLLPTSRSQLLLLDPPPKLPHQPPTKIPARPPQKG